MFARGVFFFFTRIHVKTLQGVVSVLHDIDKLVCHFGVDGVAGDVKGVEGLVGLQEVHELLHVIHSLPGLVFPPGEELGRLKVEPLQEPVAVHAVQQPAELEAPGVHEVHVKYPEARVYRKSSRKRRYTRNLKVSD